MKFHCISVNLGIVNFNLKEKDIKTYCQLWNSQTIKQVQIVSKRVWISSSFMLDQNPSSFYTIEWVIYCTYTRLDASKPHRSNCTHVLSFHFLFFMVNTDEWQTVIVLYNKKCDEQMKTEIFIKHVKTKLGRIYHANNLNYGCSASFEWSLKFKGIMLMMMYCDVN